jgi:hypothetical protein
MHAVPYAVYTECLAEVAAAARLVTVYLLYEQRQEWYDWNGSNVATNSSVGVHASLDQAEHHAERSRKQGSMFCIDEVPCLAIDGTASVLLLGEVRTEQPFRTIADLVVPMPDAKLAAFDEATRGVRNRLRYLFRNAASLQPLKQALVSRSSSPGRGGNGLGWSLRPRQMDTSHLVRMQSQVNRLIAYNISLQADRER